MIKRLIKKVFGKNSVERLFRLKCRIYNGICSFFPMKKEIILESHPDFTCNTFELYRYMISQGINKQYKITWLVDRNTKITFSDPNVDFLVRDPKGFLAKFKCYLRCNRACAVVTSNRHIPKDRVSVKQLNIYLDHGSHLKGLQESNGQNKQLKCDFVTSQSEFFVKYNVEQYSLHENQVVCTGLPRNDQFFSRHTSLNRLIPDCSEFQKIIIWVPTFRLHKDNVRLDCKHTYPLGLPILNSIDEAVKLNETLVAANVLLIIKPHPAQSLDVIKALELSNIRYLYNKDMAEQDIQLNELLEQTDAMITDYSSIYYDYLLLHRPIAITLDDFEDYNRDKGFVFDNPLDILKGVYLYNLSDFENFVNEIAHDIDSARDQREEVCRLVHTFDDNQSSSRVCNFILSKLDKRFK